MSRDASDSSSAKSKRRNSAKLSSNSGRFDEVTPQSSRRQNAQYSEKATRTSSYRQNSQEFSPSYGRDIRFSRSEANSAYLRAENTGSSGSFGRTQRSDSGSFSRTQRADTSGSFARTQRADTSGSFARTQRADTSGSFARTPRPDASGSFARTPRPDNSGSFARTQRADNSGSFARTPRPDASGSFARAQRADTSGSTREGNERPDESGSFKISKFSELKRNFSKSKASKEFTKQFGDTTSAAASSGPRAALYKGEMGRQHKKITKMQDSPEKKRGFSFPSFGLKSVGVLTIVLGLVFSCAFLYPSAQQYYQSMRDYAQAEAEYAAVLDRNDSIESQVNQLSTEQGIEDRVRSEYGYVKEGETAATVYGLNTDDKEKVYNKSVPSGSVDAPAQWYTPILDIIFGVK